MRAGAVLAGLAVLGGAVAASAQGATPETVVDLTTRPGVTQRLLVLRPAEPQGSVILFAGGHGVLSLSPEGRFGWGAGNFLMRSRALFAAAGLVTAVMDVASDLKGSGEEKSGYRFSSEHAEDVRAVVAHLRALRGPVVLVGTSRGTLRDIPLGRIRVPVLLVHHRQDPCRAAPFADMGWLRGALSGSPAVELHAVTAGGPERGDPCEAYSHHGFVGVEREVVEVIASWVKARAR